jgi:hypothetical protein
MHILTFAEHECTVCDTLLDIGLVGLAASYLECLHR